MSTDQSVKFDRSVSEARAQIAHTCDGPVTSFVLISRAVELAAKGTFQPDVIAEALDVELVTRHMLTEGSVERSSEEPMCDDSYCGDDY